MYKKITTIMLVSVFVLSLLIICGDCLSSQLPDNEEVTETEEIANNVAEALAANGENHEDPEDYIWDSSEVIPIVLDGNDIFADGADAIIDGSTITIKSGGTYGINGTLTDGQIIVDSDGKKTVRLILNGVNISCSPSAAVFVKNAKKTIVVLAENTENYISDGRPDVFEGPDADEPNAAIFSKDNLTICGDGSLTVEGNVYDGIACKDGLIIAGGTIAINAIDDGIRGKDYLIVRDANIFVNAGSDGLKSDNENDATMGYIYIETGIVDVNSGGDAITAETDVLISDGRITLYSGGGSSSIIDPNASARGIKAVASLIIDGGSFIIDSADDAVHSDNRMVINGGTFLITSGDDGLYAESELVINGGDISITKCDEGIESTVITINDGIIHITASRNGINAAEYISIEYGVIDITVGGDAIAAGTDVMITDGQITISTGTGRNRTYTGTSAKGIKAVLSCIIDGGNFIINSADDSVHSNGDMEINGGTFSISSADDGLHADANLVINGGDIHITKSYEGIESFDADITINGGNIRIVSSDDGINVAGGGDNFMPGGMGGPGRGGTPTTPAPAGDYCLYINGGYIAINADGDGIDSNGSIVMTDGVVIVNGPTSNMNGALDHSSFKMTGGFLIAAGSSGMAQAPDTSSTQYAILLTLNKTLSAGTLVHIQNSKGENILSFVPTKTYSSVAFSSQELTRGSTYDVYYGGTSTGTANDGLYEDGT